MEQKGTIHHIGQREDVGDKGFYKRTIVLAFKDGSYDKFLAIDFAKEKGDKLNGLNIGHEVTVSFNLDSREWNGKWFTSASGWKVEGNAQPIQQQQAQQVPFGEPDPNDTSLPF